MATKIHIFLSHGTLILFVVCAWGQDTLPWPIRKRKLYWRMVGQIFVLKLNWHPCCRPPAKFLAKELPGWANPWNQVCMQVWMSMRAQKPNYESSPKSETFGTEFLQWIFTHHRFLKFLWPLSGFHPYFLYISHLFPHHVFSWAVFKACCKSNSPQVHVELLNLPRSSGC